MALRNGINSPRVERRHLQVPENWMQVIWILAEAMALLCYTERRYIFYLPRAVVHAVLDKDKKTIGSECRERSDCEEVKGREILKELYELKRLLRRAMLFSSGKRFLAFLFAAGFDEEDVLYRKRTSRILKPAFTVIRDKESKCLLVFIRGTRSIKDTLTDALCAPVSFDHNMVSGYAHRGMVAAADWITKRCVPILRKALSQYSDFEIKIVGHSLGGGTAALLTYNLREMEEFSSRRTTCVTFGSAACVTLELAKFGKPFITSIVNGSDIVPTLSASSIHDFIAEDRKDNKNVLSAMRARFSSAKAIAKDAVNYCTEVVKKHKHSLFQRGTSFEPLLSESIDDDEYDSWCEGSDNDVSDDDNIDAKDKDIIEEHRVSQIRRHLYPPGRIMHMITSHMSENSNSNHSDADEKHVCLYQTPTQLYGKLRFSRGMILDHRTNRYLKKLQQLINTLEKE